MSIQSALYLTPKSTFYNSKKDIVGSGLKLHDELFMSDRELYTYLLYFKNSTYYSKSLIIKKLLSSSLHKDEHAVSDELRLDIENALILNALYSENMTHALKMLLILKKSKVNNRRTSEIILSFLFNRMNIDTISLKYKVKIKDLLIHALGLSKINKIFSGSKEGLAILKKMTSKYSSPWVEETVYFVFNKEFDYKNEKFIEYLNTRDIFKTDSITNLNQVNGILPIEVLIGFRNCYRIPVPVSALYNKGVVSEKQKIQLQNTFLKNEVEIKVDYDKLSPMDLYKYLYSGKNISDQDKILKIIEKKLSEYSIDTPENACVIWDCSLSHGGSNESKLAPHIKNILLNSVFNLNLYRFGGYQKDGLIYPDGDSDLLPALLTAIEDGFKTIYILSDGFENSGDFDIVMDKVRELYKDLNIIHFNPVFSAKNYSAKSLHESIPVIPFKDENDFKYLNLFMMLNSDPETFKKTLREIIVRELI